MTDVTLHPAHKGPDYDEVVRLCWDYRAHLMSVSGISAEVTDAFHPEEKYAALMESLPVLHARPSGAILLARAPDGTPLGCAMSHPLDTQTSEIKRVFVTSAARGMGVAELLCNALVSQALSDGFSRVVLDTHQLLHAAQRLYTRLGFTRRGPYQPIPDAVVPELVFFEKSLESSKTSA